LATGSRILKLFSLFALIGATFLALAVPSARAAELVMFAQAGCSWCEAFDSEIGTIYGKTEDGLRAPLRHVDIMQPLPPDLSFVQVERLTPLFVLVDKGREIGRIRGYGGRESFWTQLFMLMEKLDKAAKNTKRAQESENALRVNG
jgi:thioredoxin-related protein